MGGRIFSGGPAAVERGIAPLPGTGAGIMGSTATSGMVVVGNGRAGMVISAVTGRRGNGRSGNGVVGDWSRRRCARR